MMGVVAGSLLAVNVHTQLCSRTRLFLLGEELWSEGRVLPRWGCQVTRSASLLPSAPCHVPAAPRSRRSPASPAPRVLVPSPWPSSRSVPSVGHSRLLPPVICTAAVSSGSDTLESCELFFNFFLMCVKKTVPWVCLRIAVEWSELTEMGWVEVVDGAQPRGSPLVGAPLLGCGVFSNQVHRLDEDREKQGSRFTKGWSVPSWERDGARQQRSRSWGPREPHWVGRKQGQAETL